jgi:hypothetical protein
MHSAHVYARSIEGMLGDRQQMHIQRLEPTGVIRFALAPKNARKSKLNFDDGSSFRPCLGKCFGRESIPSRQYGHVRRMQAGRAVRLVCAGLLATFLARSGLDEALGAPQPALQVSQSHYFLCEADA